LVKSFSIQIFTFDELQRLDFISDLKFRFESQVYGLFILLEGHQGSGVEQPFVAALTLHRGGPENELKNKNSF
jgi:hypothetical protein